MKKNEIVKSWSKALRRIVCAAALASFPVLFANAQNTWNDMTEMYIVNPDFDGSANGWICSVQNANSLGYQGASYNNGDVAIRQFVEAWRDKGSGALGAGTISQAVSLTSGKYRLEADLIATWQGANGGWWGSEDEFANNVYLFAQQGNASASKTAVATMNNRPQHFSHEFSVTSTGLYNLGVLIEDGGNANWVAMDNVRLYWYGKMVYVTGITLNHKTLTLEYGQKSTLTATVSPANATVKNVKWESLDPDIVTVDASGNIEAVGEGNATIIAYVDDGDWHEATCDVTVTIPSVNADGLIINEIMASNVDYVMDPSFNYGSWIEIYNPTSASTSVGGLYISDDPENLKKFRLSPKVGVVPAKGYKNIWFDHFGIWGKGELTQVDFKLDYDGGTIILSDGTNIIAQQDYPQAIGRTSYARTSDGGDTWAVSAAPTPEATNKGMTFATEQLPAPEVDKPAQMFSSSMNVKVTIPSGATLRYTTDGTTPTLDNGETSANGTFTVDNSVAYRFRLFQSGKLPSEVVTRTYIKSSSKLNVISVVTDPDHIYDTNIGLFQKGPNGRAGNGQDSKCNWNMDWDRPVNFEYITSENNECVLSQEVDMSMCGGWSRAWTPHSFKLKAAKYYMGQNSLDYQFFDEKPFLKHKVLQIRNGGNNGLLKDASLQEMMKRSGLHVETQSWTPVNVYINGQFYAQLNMREPNNKHYGYANYGIDTDYMDQFEMSPDSGYVQMSGTKESFDRLLSLSYSANSGSTFAEIEKLLDIDEYVNYMAAELYLGNWDWPQNNVKGFRDQEDGKFRFVIYDLDGSFNTSSPINTFAGKENYTFDSLRGQDALGNVLTGQRKYQQIEVVTLFKNLLQNENFRRKMVDAMCVIGGSTFSRDFAYEVAHDMSVKMSYGSGSDIANNFNSRQSTIVSHIKSNSYYDFGIKNESVMNVNLSSPAEGSDIYVNDYRVPMGKFSGQLYTPVTVKAVAPAGYTFKGWALDRGTVGGGDNTETIFGDNTDWTYDDSDTPLDDTDWQTKSFSQSGKAPLGYDTNGSKNFETNIAERLQTYYFTKKFNLKNVSDDDVFTLNYTVDDAMVVYVNGKEAGRYNLPSGEISFYTNGGWAKSNPDTGVMTLPAGLFKVGDNTIAVEVHNYFNPSSTDIYWSASLSRTAKAEADANLEYVTTNPEYTIPSGSAVSLRAVYAKESEDDMIAKGIMPVKVNEVSAGNDIYVSDYFKKDDWFELYNTTDEPIDVAGMYVSDNEAKPQKFQIPASDDVNTVIEPHGHLVIWASKRAIKGDQIHASFKLANDDVTEGQVIMLTSEEGDWNDILAYPKHGAKETVGLYPDGSNQVYHLQRPTINKANGLVGGADFLYTYEYKGVDNDPQEKQTFTLDLAEGWNWMSHPLERNIATTEVNQSALAIVGQKAQAKKEATGWTGTLTSLKPTESYKMQMAESASISFEDVMFNPANTIALAKGWNWVGYPLQSTYSVSDALSQFTPSEGDVMLGRDGFATYENGKWSGSLDMLEPGEGFMYKAAAPASLRYTVPTASTRQRKAPFRAQPRSFAAVDQYAHPDVMGMVAQFVSPQATVDVDALNLEAVGDDDTTRGVGKVIDGKLFINIFGTASSKENIRLRAVSASGEVYEIAETFSFASDVLGSRKQPVQLTVGAPVDIASTRYCTSLSAVGYYSLSGALVSDSKSTLSKGVYVVKYRMNDGTTIAKKVMVK